MELIKAADAAWPGDMSTLDADIPVILGYVGEPGHTPHIWAPSQVDTVRNDGRHWWPIQVPPQGSLNADIGSTAADMMIEALPNYGVTKTDPAFLDIEASSWVASAVGANRAIRSIFRGKTRAERLEALFAANPAGAMACIGAFKTTMKSAGYIRPYVFVPAVAGFDWIAKWTGTAPASLPADVIGQQFQSTAAWDFSVFDASLLDLPAPPAPSPEPAPKENERMFVFHRQKPDLYILVAGGLTVIIHHSSPTIANLKAKGAEFIVVDDDTYADMETQARAK